MREEALDISTPDGTADAILYRSEDGSRLPGAIFYTDIGGIRPSQHDKARRLAGAGYAVLMPNIFYRTGRPPVLPRREDVPDDVRMQRVAEIRAPLVAEAMERDTAAYADALVATGASDDGPLAVVGYCFSGKMAVHTAAARPERIGAAASFHGGHLVTDEPTSPHRLLSRIKARLYFGHAVEDASMPPDAIATLDAALAAWGGIYESEIYEGAYHSWTEPESPVYNAKQAERAWGKLIETFAGMRSRQPWRDMR